METNSTNQSNKIQERISDIHTYIELHHKNIKSLLYVIENNKHIKATPFAYRVIKYNCIPISEKRFLWTLQNLKDQIIVLETELKTLIRYMVNEEETV